MLLGGRTTHLEGFTNVDLYEGEEVDVKADVSDLSMFESGSVHEIYASHILEHFSHKKTVAVLSEWRRVLKKAGKLYISVPDFDAMIKLYNIGGLTDFIRNTLYGDQLYDLAYHYTAFTYATLGRFCVEAGFSDVKRLQELPYGLVDCSHNRVTSTGGLVSINAEVIA